MKQDELLEQLRGLVDQRRQLDEAEHKIVKQLRELGWQGTRWDVIGEALGISRQAVMKRHAQRLADESKDTWQHRRRFDAGRARSQ